MAIDCNTHVNPTCLPPGIPNGHLKNCFTRRFNTATRQALFPQVTYTTNGDENLADFCGSYSKGIKQKSPGIVDPIEFGKFKAAIANADFNGFEGLVMGGPNSKLNGPMGSYAYAFLGADCTQFGDETVKAPPAVASEAYATELIELYWCSLLRDQPFTELAQSQTALDACAELSNDAHFTGPTDNGAVTPALLFRGDFSGERIGPYVSQFLLTPTMLGAAPFAQKYQTYTAGVDYMSDLDTWFAVQNGIGTGAQNQKNSDFNYLHTGRDLASYTHVDELYQAYFTAYIALKTISSSNPLPNPQNPYHAAKNQNGFGTFGGPDIAAVLAEVAKLALNACWYQKWVIHLRHRPEAGGGLVHLIKANGTHFDAQPLPRALDSKAVQASFNKYGTYLLSQPFPEGSPNHPAYPTGHGAVGGACITILKFFFNGDAVINNPQVPSSDGSALHPWDYNPATGKPGLLTVNGELHKLAHNVTFGHGLHGGIHWRSDSDASIRLGQAVAIRYLQDLACSYAETVNVSFKDLDGNLVTISN